MTRFKGKPAFLNSLMDTEGERPNRLPMTQVRPELPDDLSHLGCHVEPGRLYRRHV